MSSTRRASSLRSTPKSRRSLIPGVNGYLQDDVRCTLSLEAALGYTTSNPNGFSSNAHSRQFALCSGAAAVLYEMGHHGAISHRIFRADPFSFVGPISHVKGNPVSSLATIDSSKRRRSALRMSGTNGSPRSPIHSVHDGSHIHASPGKSKAISRNRIATCVALSPDGQLLAVGEVRSTVFPTGLLDMRPPAPPASAGLTLFGFQIFPETSLWTWKRGLILLMSALDRLQCKSEHFLS